MNYNNNETSESGFSSNLIRIGLFLLLAAVAFGVYYPGLSGDFEFDDAVNILDNEALRITSLSWRELANATTSGASGPLGRPISMLSFALNYLMSGFDPYFFKLTNIFVHLLSGAGVYFLTRQLLGALAAPGLTVSERRSQEVTALIIAGVWLLHPLNVTSVLYVVQRMSSLAAMFSFFAVGLYVMARRDMLQGLAVRGCLLAFCALGPVTFLGIMCKENAALAPLLMLVIEVVFFRFKNDNPLVRRILFSFFALVLLVPLLAVAVNFDRISAYLVTAYQTRDFTLSDRLLTQPRVLAFYLRLIVMPSAGTMGLYHDDFPTSTGLFTPPTTALALAFWAAVVLVGAFCIRRAPVVAFAIFWFLAGHVMESSFIPLEMVHEHRNYLPMLGPIFAAAYYAAHWKTMALSIRLKTAILVAVVLMLAGVTLLRSLQWSNLVEHAAIEVRNHPQSLRANYQMARLYFKLFADDPKPEYQKLSEKHFLRAAERAGVSVFPFTGLVQLAYKARVAPDPKWIDEIKSRVGTVDWEPNMVALNGLLLCQIQYYCNLSQADVIGLLFAVLDNPRSSLKTKGTAYSLLGNYYALKLADFDNAKKYLNSAVEAEPARLQYRLDLVGILAARGELEDARAQIAKARRIDAEGKFTERLNAEVETLDKLSPMRKTDK